MPTINALRNTTSLLGTAIPVATLFTEIHSTKSIRLIIIKGNLYVLIYLKLIITTCLFTLFYKLKNIVHQSLMVLDFDFSFNKTLNLI